MNYFVYNNRIVYQKSLLKVSITKAADFLSPFPMFIKITSGMSGNALYSISLYSCERHAAERKEEVGNCTEMFYISREREEY